MTAVSSLAAAGSETKGCCKPSPDVRKASGQRFDQYPSIICSAGSQTSLMSDQHYKDCQNFEHSVLFMVRSTWIIICQQVFLQISVDSYLH